MCYEASKFLDYFIERDTDRQIRSNSDTVRHSMSDLISWFLVLVPLF